MIPLYIKNIFLLYMSFQYLFRIIILGHPAVGKSSLLSVLTNRPMSLFHEPTIGIDFASTLDPHHRWTHSSSAISGIQRDKNISAPSFKGIIVISQAQLWCMMCQTVNLLSV